MKRYLYTIVFAALALTSCSKAQKSATSAPTPEIRLHPFTEKTLSNGLRVLLVEDKSLPYISYGLLVQTGSASDPNHKAGLANIVAELLEKGTTTRTAMQIADQLGQLGSSFGVSVQEDFSYFSTSGITTSRDQLLRIFVDIVTSPSFTLSETNRLKKQLKAAMIQSLDEPSVVANMAFRKFLYGEHPYGHTIMGNQKALANIRRKDIIRHYLQYYRPNNAILTVVGQYSPNIINDLERHFRDWKKRPVKGLEISKPEMPSSVSLQFVEKPDLVQTQIVMGHPGISRTEPDYLTLRVANTILGTGFSSRLVNQIRDNLGLTYSIGSSFDALAGVGPFSISTFTRHEKVGQTLAETLRLYKVFQQSGVKAAEVAQAKGYLWGHFLRSVETAEKLAFNLLVLRLYGIPDSYLTQFRNNLDQINVSEVNSVIQKHFHPEKMKIVVHSSSTTLPQVQKIGPVEQRSFKEFQ